MTNLIVPMTGPLSFSKSPKLSTRVFLTPCSSPWPPIGQHNLASSRGFPEQDNRGGGGERESLLQVSLGGRADAQNI